MININLVREQFKNGTLNKKGWDIQQVLHSDEFYEYWKSKTKYSFDQIEKLVYKHLPQNKTMAFWCIAGGAVGNLIYSFLSETEPVLNDVDVFVWVPGSSYLNEQGYYVDDKARFLKVERDGDFNIIYKSDGQLTRRSNNGNYSKQLREYYFVSLIKEFDFNSCMAYFQPYTKNNKFVVESSFYQFVHEKQLKIYNFHHPLSTLIRGVKKAQELDVKFDKNKVVEVLAHLFSQIEIDKTHLGDKKKLELENNLDILEPWFNYDPLSRTFFSKIEKQEQVKYERLSKSNVFSFFKLPEHQRDNAWFLIENHFTTTKTIAQTIWRTKVVIPDFSKERVKKYADFSLCHNFSSVINVNYINDWINLISAIKKYSDKLSLYEKDYFVGIAELYLRNNKNQYYEQYFSKNFCPNIEKIIEVYQQSLKEESETLLTVPLNIPEEFKNNIIELITKRDLRTEGQILQHCVGGYSGIVTSGRSKIFKIRVGEEKATLELGVTNQGGENMFYFNRQLRGIKNSQVSENLEKMVIKFIETINKH